MHGRDAKCRRCRADLPRPYRPQPQHGHLAPEVRPADLRHRQDLRGGQAICTWARSKTFGISSRGNVQFGKVVVETIPTPHDAEDGVVFVVDDGKHRLGILTDLGHVFDGLGDVIASLDAVLLESNYDPDMLANCPRPEWLKERIAGPGGHISNFEAAELLWRQHRSE